MGAAERLYLLLTDEDDVADADYASIPDEAADAVPGSFLLNAANGASTKLAEQLASPGVVLPLLLSTVGAPVLLVGLLEPLRRGLATAPQLAVSGRIRQSPVRKWYWVAAGVAQGLALGFMALAAAVTHGLAAGLLIVGALAVFSLASGVGSVAFSDVLGKTIPEGKRSQLLAVRATLGGIFTVAAGLTVARTVQRGDDVAVFVWLLLAAALLWLAGAGLFARIAEPHGWAGAARNPLEEARTGLRELVAVPGFRRFLTARALLLGVELAIPFYALLARGDERGGELGLFIVAVGVSAAVGSPLWGRIGDRISTRVLMAAGGAVGVLGSAAALLLVALDAPTASFAIAMFLGGLARAGVRLGRKTYIVDASPEDKRPLYVAASNTAAGVIMLAAGGLGVVADAFGVEAVVWLVLTLGLVGIAAVWWMPPAHEMAAGGTG